jgi:hypothetical protein
MSEIIHERRRLLLSTAAWVGGLAAVAANRLARAFQVEEMPPTGAVGRAYANRCSSGSPEHEALIARLQALLANDPSAASMTATCPILRLPGDRQPVGGPVKQALMSPDLRHAPQATVD